MSRATSSFPRLCRANAASPVHSLTSTFARHPQFHSRSNRIRQSRYFETAPPRSTRRPIPQGSSLDSPTLFFALVITASVTYFGYRYSVSEGSTFRRQESGQEVIKASKDTPLREQPSTPGRPEDEIPQIAKSLQHTLIMLSDMPPGRPGNLTPEQETKLKEMWAQTLKFFGMSHEEVPKAQANGILNRSSTGDSTPTKKKRSLLGKFGRKDKDTPDEDGSGGDAMNDKHGAVKEYEQALASMKPEEIREAFWHMTKMDHPDAILLRFLRARKWDVQAAQIMALSTLHWRLKDFKVDEDVMFNGEAQALEDSMSGTGTERKLGHDFIDQMRLGKSFFHGVDKDGRPICHVRARFHKAGQHSVESLERVTVHTIETGRLLLRPPVDTATIIFDMTGFSMANMDYNPVKFMIKVFEANYPESLGRIVVYKSPYLFQGIWRIIKGWLDPVVASKINLCSDVDELSQIVPKSQIIKELGGDDDWEYEYVEPAEGENEKMKDVEGKKKLLNERMELVKEYEAETLKWINGDEEKVQVRDGIAQKLADNYWALDPFIRARSLYDRVGVLKPGGQIDFYSDKHEKEASS